MMKRIFTGFLVGAMLVIFISAHAQQGLLISEITDPADDFTGRFIELFNAGAEAVDFSSAIFYLSRQSNGGTSWGDVQLTGSVAAGKTYIIGGSAFEAIYGFAPDLVTGILIGNGDDAYCLYREGDHTTGTLQDIYGEIDTDGTGTSWEYVDSRAERVAGVVSPRVVWSVAEWEITPANVIDCDPGTHHGSSGNDTIPASGDYSMALINDTVDGIQPVEVPVSVSELTLTDNIISYQFDVTFDQTVLEYTGFSVDGTLAAGGTVVVNTAVPGRLSVSYMHSTALTGTGIMLFLRFNALVPDTTELQLSNAYLNNIPVQQLTDGMVIITENSPPTARMTYDDMVNRYADTLKITAIFSESMDDAVPVQLTFSGAVALTDADMARLNDTVYTYLFPIPKAEGVVTLRLSNGTDLWGNDVVPVPTGGETFTITAFTPGDVDDDGMILAYDAALTLQYSVGMDPLPLVDPLPWENWRDSTANVDGSGGISAYDASLILQYSAGLIAGFSEGTAKSAPLVEVTAEVMDRHILFFSRGELLGLNLSTTGGHDLLGTPQVLAKDFLSAWNITATTYQIGLCSAYAPPEGIAFMKIPFTGSGPVTFHMVMNTTEGELTVDLATGMAESEHKKIVIFPVPATDWLNIDGITGWAVTRIYNVHGQLQLTTPVGGSAGKINLGPLAPGVYMIQIETDRETVVRRFTRQ